MLLTACIFGALIVRDIWPESLKVPRRRVGKDHALGQRCGAYRVACLLCFDYLLRETFQPAWGIRKAQAQRFCRAGRQLRRRGLLSIQGPRRERRKRYSNRQNSTEKL